MTQHKELIERLRSGADAEKDAWTDSGIISGMEYTMESAADAMEALEREKEALREDAERWRWLAENCDGDDQDDFTNWLCANVVSKELIDAYVDTCIRREQQQAAVQHEGAEDVKKS